MLGKKHAKRMAKRAKREARETSVAMKIPKINEDKLQKEKKEN
jgi:hypothetical protein